MIEVDKEDKFIVKVGKRMIKGEIRKESWDNAWFINLLNTSMNTLTTEMMNFESILDFEYWLVGEHDLNLSTTQNWPFLYTETREDIIKILSIIERELDLEDLFE